MHSPKSSVFFEIFKKHLTLFFFVYICFGENINSDKIMECSGISCVISCIANVAEIVGVGFAIFGAILAYVQWRHGKKVERNSQMRSLITGLLDDERIYKIILDIDHGRLEGIQGTENEGPVDALLFNLNYVCHSYRKKLVDKDDISLIDYLLNRILKNHEIQDYLDFMENFSKENGVESPFSELVKYNGERKKSINRR
ncbi:hypothetical protein B7993_12475 [Fibrobacter sp. UWH3]|nr:hypothetical protein B7993_12475 [Fibrobacter sp. UWH3]